MIIQLVSLNQELINEWINVFSGIPEVIIHYGDIFGLSTDCIVSPANSFGFMDGGLDLLISEKLGWQVQERVQEVIKREFNNELLVGQALIVNSGSDLIPYCIAAPTMRTPMRLTSSINVFLACKAVFNLLKSVDYLSYVSIPGMGTGTGKLPPKVCAYQMRVAFDAVSNDYFPASLEQAMLDYDSLIK